MHMHLELHAKKYMVAITIFLDNHMTFVIWLLQKYVCISKKQRYKVHFSIVNRDY